MCPERCEMIPAVLPCKGVTARFGRTYGITLPDQVWQTGSLQAANQAVRTFLSCSGARQTGLTRIADHDVFISASPQLTSEVHFADPDCQTWAVSPHTMLMVFTGQGDAPAVVDQAIRQSAQDSGLALDPVTDMMPGFVTGGGFYAVGAVDELHHHLPPQPSPVCLTTGTPLDRQLHQYHGFVSGQVVVQLVDDAQPEMEGLGDDLMVFDPDGRARGLIQNAQALADGSRYSPFTASGEPVDWVFDRPVVELAPVGPRAKRPAKRRASQH